jgi:hypothetical protein
MPSDPRVNAMSMFRFLPGIFVAQAAAAVLVFAATGAARNLDWALIGALAAIIALLVAAWFGSIAAHVRKDALADARNAFARERETLVVAAETDKRAALEETHQRIVRETNRAHARANFKLGAGLAGLLGLGGLLFAIEFVTLSLLIFATAGGALAGYLVRARQDGLASRKKAAAPVLPPYAGKTIEAEPVESAPARSIAPRRSNR